MKHNPDVTHPVYVATFSPFVMGNFGIFEPMSNVYIFVWVSDFYM